jgi:predicted GNAT family N-acyltransferase
MSRADIREITEAADMECAFAIRREVFCHEQGVSAAEEFDGLDGDCRTYLVRRSNDAIGTARARPLEDGTVKIERMAVLKPHRGRGHGRALLQRMIGDLRDDGVETVILHAQCHAEEFYRRSGFVAGGEPFMEAGIDHIRMVFTGERC